MGGVENGDLGETVGPVAVHSMPCAGAGGAADARGGKTSLMRWSLRAL